MQQRAFGIESEYSVACKRKDGKFCTEIAGTPSHDSIYPGRPFSASEVLAETMAHRDSFPPHLMRLLFFSRGNARRPDSYWLGANGARFYFDPPEKAPEYATPECTSAREAILHNIAGDTVLEDLRQEAMRSGMMEKISGNRWQDLFVFKMNTHFRPTGAQQKAVGCHENYMVRITDTETKKKGGVSFVDFMAPFFLTRQIFDGAGAIRHSSELGWHYVISQRIFFISAYVGSGTIGGTSRGVIHFRSDGSEVPRGHQRLHIHCGDAGMSPFGKYLAVAATHLALRAYEEGDVASWKYRPCKLFTLEDSRRCSEDPTVKTLFRLYCNKSEIRLSAPAIQREYLRFVKENVSGFSREEKTALHDWEVAVETLEEDPAAMSRELDWAIKLRYLRERCGGRWGDPKAQFAATLYHDLSDRGIYRRLLRGGEVRQFADSEDIAACLEHPPDTRAEFRSRYIKLLLERPDDIPRNPNWGQFGSINGGLLCINDPFARSTPEGEALLEEFRRMIERRKTAE